MSVDYDLIVIGSSVAGIYAAVEAARLKARVALITQQSSTSSSQVTKQAFTETLEEHPNSDFSVRVLQEVGRTIQQARRAEQLGIWNASGSLRPSWLRQTERWTNVVSETFDTLNSLPVLASMGIEIIEGQGEFCRKPKPGFTVNGRYLRSRSYLLATGCCPAIPTINGLQATGYSTAETVLQKIASLNEFSYLVIIGSDPVGIELAQTFSSLGVRVAVVTSGSRILSSENIEGARLVQAQLEAEGILVMTRSSVTQVKQIQEKKWVQAGNQAIEADEILVTAGWKPIVASLNLEAAGVQLDGEGIVVNQKLQTTNPHVYACTGLMDGYYASHVAVAQAKIALKNALFLPTSKVNYRYIPQLVYTEPELGRIGLSESQAIEQHGKDVLVLKQSFQVLTKAQIQGETTGFCKLNVRRNGQILGAEIVGAQASELIGTIALAMQQNLKIQALAKLAYPSPTFSEVISQTAREWYRLRLERNTFLQDLLEGFFNFRRS